jgi:hypothetical protein
MADDIYVTVEGEQSTTVTTVGEQSIQVTSVGEQGLPGSAGVIENITDVDAVNKKNGSVLVYKAVTAKWTATNTLEEQEITGGHY